MKKRVFSVLLTGALLTALLSVSALAVGNFSDVTDTATARSVEVLQLMGVLEGDGSGAFHPADSLTRAEFCKMTVVLMGGAAEAVRYQNYTIFPDVRGTHWAAGYINFAVRGGTRLIAGLPDGTFAPNRAITFGEAVTILMRLIGYTDADAGILWPEGYLNLAAEAGLTDGLSLRGGATITRAQAAQLFVNLLYTETNGGADYASQLGNLSEEVMLRSSSADGRLTVSGSSSAYTLEHRVTVSALSGMKGRLLLNAKTGKVMTFLPNRSGSAQAASSAAVLVGADGSTVGFDALTGGISDYRIVRNGVPAEAKELRKNDVAIYNPATNTIEVCDTRVAVRYESCSPSLMAPETVTVLGGNTFPVLTTARSSVAEWKPGSNMLLFLTADGQVAYAASNGAAKANATAIVRDGKAYLLCGAYEKELTLPAGTLSGVTLEGMAVQIAQTGTAVTVSSLKGGAAGDWNVAAKKIGSRSVAENAAVYDYGERVDAGKLSASYSAAEITYARTNPSGLVDLIVLHRGTVGKTYFGRASVEQRMAGELIYTQTPYLTVTYQDHGVLASSPDAETASAPRNGDYVCALYRNGRYTSVTVLDRVNGVAQSAWIGQSAVLVGGETYAVAEDLLCYNRDSKTWMTPAQAIAYAPVCDLFVYDGTVYAMEVGG